MTRLRPRRALVAVAFVWGIVWAAVAMIAGTMVAVIDPTQIDAGEAPIVLAPVIGLVGFGCGLAFAAVACAPGRQESIFDVPPARVVATGILVAALVPVLTGKILPEVLVVAPLGAVSAMLSTAVVRRWAALRSTA